MPVPADLGAYRGKVALVVNVASMPIPESAAMANKGRRQRAMPLMARLNATDLASLAEQMATGEVVATVPKEKLLVYRPGDGWEPLCTFLGVPVPATPYPKTNSTEEFNQMFTKR